MNTNVRRLLVYTLLHCYMSKWHWHWHWKPHTVGLKWSVILETHLPFSCFLMLSLCLWPSNNCISHHENLRSGERTPCLFSRWCYILRDDDSYQYDQDSLHSPSHKSIRPTCRHLERSARPTARGSATTLRQDALEQGCHPQRILPYLAVPLGASGATRS